MEQILNTIGIDTKLLHKEPIHTREQTIEILGISPTTLKKYEKNNLIQSASFRRRKYYSTQQILKCIKTQFNLNIQSEWDKVWE